MTDIISNNSLTTATNVGSLTSNFRSWSDSVNFNLATFYDDRNDVFRFTIDTASNFNLNLSLLNSNFNPNILSVALADANGTTLRSGIGGSIIYTGLAAGTYYIGLGVLSTTVAQYPSGAFLGYNLSMSATPLTPTPTPPPVITPTATPDRINGIGSSDAGNSTATANLLNGSGISTVTGAVGGVDTNDFYRFVATNSGIARFSLADLRADIDLRLLNSAGTLVVESSAGSTSNENISFNVVAGQTYFVQVAPYLTAVSNYNLSVTLPAAPPTAPIPVISLTSTPVTHSEGNSGSTLYTFTVTRSNGNGASTVNYSVNGATDSTHSIAASANDFVGATSGVVTFANGILSQIIPVYVAGDTALPLS